MKNSLACPKCQSRKLWRIEKYAAKTEHGGGPCHLRPAVLRKGAAKRGFLGVSTPELYDSGYTDAYICSSCGYTEFWSHGFEGLVPNPDDGVHLIDTTPQQGEYR